MADSVLMTFEHIGFGGSNWAFGIESTAVQRGFDASILRRVEFEERISSFRLDASRGSCEAFLFESDWGISAARFIGASASKGHPSHNTDLRASGLNDQVSAIMLVGLPDGHEDRRFSLNATAMPALAALLSSDSPVVFEPSGGSLNRETWQFRPPTASWGGFPMWSTSALRSDRTFAQIRIPVTVSVQRLLGVVEEYACSIYLVLSAEVVASRLVVRIVRSEVESGEGFPSSTRRGSVEQGLGIYLGWNRLRLETAISDALTTALADVLSEFQRLGQTLTPTAALFLPGTILGSADWVLGDLGDDATLAVQGSLS